MKLTRLMDNAVQPSSAFEGEHGLAFLVDCLFFHCQWLAIVL
jgi:metal-dependent hydrolase (beta-lactamase superfamily II)